MCAPTVFLVSEINFTKDTLFLILGQLRLGGGGGGWEGVRLVGGRVVCRTNRVILGNITILVVVRLFFA